MHPDLVPDTFVNTNQQGSDIRCRISMQYLDDSAWSMHLASSLLFIFRTMDKNHPIFLVFMMHDRHIYLKS